MPQTLKMRGAAFSARTDRNITSGGLGSVDFAGKL